MSRVGIAVLLSALLLSAIAVQVQADGTVALRLKAARYLARGDTGLASANDGATIGYNPANLASVSISHYADGAPFGEDPAPFKTECANTLEVSGDFDQWSLLRALRDVRKDWGLGLGFVGLDGEGLGDWWTVGYGTRLGKSAWNGGIAFQHVDAGLLSASGKNLINLGFQGRVYERDGLAVDAGFLVRDLTGRLDAGPLYNAGLAATYRNTLVEVNFWDFTDEINSSINFGVEQKLDPYWSLYAGVIDGDDLTAGVGYIRGWWNLAVGWMESPRGTDLGDTVLVTCGRRIRF